MHLQGDVISGTTTAEIRIPGALLMTTAVERNVEYVFNNLRQSNDVISTQTVCIHIPITTRSPYHDQLRGVQCIRLPILLARYQPIDRD